MRPSTPSFSPPSTLMRRKAELPAKAVGCGAQAHSGNAPTSARSRSASKRTGRRMNGCASFMRLETLDRLPEAGDRVDDVGDGRPLGFRQMGVPDIEDQHDPGLAAAVPRFVLVRIVEYDDPA